MGEAEHQPLALTKRRFSTVVSRPIPAHVSAIAAIERNLQYAAYRQGPSRSSVQLLLRTIGLMKLDPALSRFTAAARRYSILTRDQERAITLAWRQNQDRAALDGLSLRFSVSRERIRQIEQRAISKISTSAATAQQRWVCLPMRATTFGRIASHTGPDSVI